MKADGFSLTFDAIKVVSLTTGRQPDGTYEFYAHLMGGKGVERHLHGYAVVDAASGKATAGGARLKHGVLQHAGPALVLAHSTQELARLSITREGGGMRTEFQQISDAASFVTGSTGIGTVTRRPVELPGASGADGAEYSIAMFDSGTRLEPATTDRIVLPFSSPTPFGISVTLLRRW